MSINLKDFLEKYNACEPLIEWAKDINNSITAYNNFNNGSQLCWLYMRTNPNNKKILCKICIECFDTIKDKFNDIIINNLYNKIIDYSNNNLSNNDWLELKNCCRQIELVNRGQFTINIQKYYYTLSMIYIIMEEFDKSLAYIDVTFSCYLEGSQVSANTITNMLSYANIFKKYVKYEDFNTI
jgi:hypothetical protein